MRIFITGGSGFVGWNLARELKGENEIFWTYLNNQCSQQSTKSVKLDITNFAELKNQMEMIRPDLVIHTVAVPSVDTCERDHELADKVNIQGTGNVAEICAKTGSKVVFISTSHVFSGNEKSYDENRKPDPINYYGYTKAQGEKKIIESGAAYIIARIDQPYGWIEPWQKKNSVVRALDSLKKGEKLREITDWYNTPVFIEDLTRAIGILIREGKKGIYNIVGPDFINRCQWSQKVANAFGYSKSLIEPIKSTELALPGKRPKVFLSNKKIERETCIKMRSIDACLQVMRSTRLEDK